MDRFKQLAERDVRKNAPDLDPATFLALYLASNFPQTAALPSEDQKNKNMMAATAPNGLDSFKKPNSGTSFDRPQAY